MRTHIRSRQVINKLEREIQKAYKGNERDLFGSDPEKQKKFDQLSYAPVDQVERDHWIQERISAIASQIFDKEQNRLNAIKLITPEKDIRPKVDPLTLRRRAPHQKAAEKRKQAAREEKKRSEERAAELKEAQRKNPPLFKPEKRFTFHLNRNEAFSKSHLFALTAVSQLKRISLDKSVALKSNDEKAKQIAEEKLKAYSKAVLKYFHPSFLKKVLKLKGLEFSGNMLQSLVKAKSKFEIQNNGKTFSKEDQEIKLIADDIRQFFDDKVIPKETLLKQALENDFNEAFAQEMPNWLYQNLAKFINAPKIKLHNRIKNPSLNSLKECLNPYPQMKSGGAIDQLKISLVDQINKLRRSFNRIAKPYEESFFKIAQDLIGLAA